MNCLNCGKPANAYLCSDCQTPEILEEIFNDLRYYNSETCENPYVAEFVSGLEEKNAQREIIPDILELFDFEITEYYYCLYYRTMKDARFEDAAIAYINAHKFEEIHTQRVLYDLISGYIPGDFTKPKKWCEKIAATDNLCCEMYGVAAKYFAMIGEYDLADTVADKGLELCCDESHRVLLFTSPENMIATFHNQKEATHKYRTKKPYWPKKEENRRALAKFYDEKGIKYPRIENKPKKVKESDFAPIQECFDDGLADYCAFWCADAFSIVSAKSIYQIAAVKVRNGEITQEFQQFVRPWEGSSEIKDAAKQAGVDYSVIDSAEDVDQVMPKFFEFVGDDVLLSTAALGKQAKLISRAARHAGMKEIKNAFYDILDLAADTSADFDLANNTREYLLSSFGIEEGKTALEKAKINKILYDKLLSYGD